MKQQSPAMNQLIQQHSMSNNLLSNNPSMISSNTPQQQIYQQHLQSVYNNPLSTNMQQLDNQQLNMNALSNGPSSVPNPSSVSSGLNIVPSHSQNSNLVSQNLSSNITPSPISDLDVFDPIAAVKILMSRDLRTTIMDVNLAAERVSQKFLGTSNINTNSNAADDKRIMAPQSINPLSVTNPQSMSNPMSVNMPNSVKSISDEKISLGQMNDSSDVIENPIDVYNNSINNFLNTCDEIKKNLQVIMEVNRRMQRFEGTCSLRTPSDMTNLGFPQLQQHYIDLMQSDKRSLKDSIQRMNQLRNRIRPNLIPNNSDNIDSTNCNISIN